MHFPRLLPYLGLILVASAEPAPVSFKADIAPLLNRRCAACHNEETAKGRYRLDTYARLLKPGESDAKPIVQGKPDDSEFFRLLTEPDPHDRMPQKADPLPGPELALLRRWIEQGAPFDGGSPDRPLVEMARESFLRAAPEHYAHPYPITALAWSPDGRRLAASGYYEVTIWRVSDGALVRRIGGLPERITALAWSAESNLLAVAGGTPFQWGTVALVEPDSGQPRLLCDLPESALAVAFSPDGRTLAAGAGDRTIRLFDAASGKQKHLFRQHADWVQSVAFSPDGKRIVSASRDRTARVFDAQTGEIEATYTGHDTPLLSAVFGSRGEDVYSVAAHQRSIHRWHFAGPVKPSITEVGSEILQFVVGKVGLITTTPLGTIEVTQFSDREKLFTLLGQGDTVQAIALSRGDVLATGGYNGQICIWEFACGTWRSRFTANP